MLRLLNERRDDRGAARSLTADRAVELLRRVRSATGLRAERRQIAADLVTDIRRLDRQISRTKQSILDCVSGSGTTLPQVPGPRVTDHRQLRRAKWSLCSESVDG
jgi:hypothetical protein